MPQLAHRLVPALVLVTTLAACGGKEGGATDSSAPNAASASASSGGTNADAELADIQSYKLSMDKIDKMLAAQRSDSAIASTEPATRMSAVRPRMPHFARRKGSSR